MNAPEYRPLPPAPAAPGPYGEPLWRPPQRPPVWPVYAEATPTVPLDTTPAHERQIGRAEGAAAQRAVDESWWDRRTAGIRGSHLVAGAVGGLVALCLCASCAAAETLGRFSLSVGVPRIAGGTPDCDHPVDQGSFSNTTVTIGTSGTGGAELAISGQDFPSHVTIIPPGITVEATGSGQEWVFPAGCTWDQVTQNAENDASQNQEPFVANYQLVPCISDPIGARISPETSQMSASLDGLRRNKRSN